MTAEDRTPVNDRALEAHAQQDAYRTHLGRLIAQQLAAAADRTAVARRTMPPLPHKAGH